MMTTKARRVTRSYRQSIAATPDVVFPLLCPVREVEWLDGWKYTMVYSGTGLIGPDAVFTTPGDDEADTIWVVSKYDPRTHVVQFVRFTPGSRTCVLTVKLSEKGRNESYADITYTYTGLTEQGNAFVGEYSEEKFLRTVKWWEESINHFINTGSMLRKL